MQAATINYAENSGRQLVLFQQTTEVENGGFVWKVILLDHIIARQCSVLFYRKELITAAENITGEQVTIRLAS
ncbi:hypothetical protein AL049_12215 [Pseudomonas syringae pv. cerasicola]|nr:hypothetical protein AL049_12215 [Pseudomonas syringae pv. cerasicola]